MVPWYHGMKHFFRIHKKLVHFLPRLNLDSFLLQHGLFALFLIGFLAASILPLGSEWLLITLVLQGQAIEPIVVVATLGNFLGACTTYAIGLYSSPFLVGRILRISPAQLDKAKKVYHKYGAWSLLFSWVPIIGDPLCLLSGSLRLNFVHFSLLTFTGKLARYIAVAVLTAKSLVTS